MRKIRYVLSVFLYLMMHINATAQQDPQWSLLNDENSSINPSTMVNDYRLNALLKFREQWAGFDGNPQTVGFNASYRVDKAWSAFGVAYTHDRLGAESTNSLLMNYAFDGKIGDHHIVPGIQLGFVSRSLGTLTAIEQNDPNVPVESSSAIIPDFGLSLAYRFKGLSVGFSTIHITEGGLKLETLSTTKVYNVARHYYAHASYDISLGNYFRLKPLVFLKSDAASTQFDNQIWFGVRNVSKYFDGASVAVGYRIDDAFVFGAEVKLRWFSIGYSYDMTTSGLNNYSSGSHEVFLRAHVFKGYRTSKAQLNRLEE